jgi:hypothetical protein
VAALETDRACIPLLTSGVESDYDKYEVLISHTVHGSESGVKQSIILQSAMRSKDDDNGHAHASVPLR